MSCISIPCDDDCCCCCFSIFNFPRHVATCLKYVLIVVITWILCLVLLVPHLRAKIVTSHEFTNIISRATLQNFFGFTAVYRVCLSVGTFHLLMFMILICVSSENGTRTSVHHGFWPVKLVVLSGIVIGMFLVSGSSWLFSVVMYIAMACGVMFSLVQVVLLVDFSHYCQGTWTAQPDDDGPKKCRNVLVLFCTLAMYLTSIICVAVLYVMFAYNTKCKTNKFFIIFISCHFIVACILSMLPIIQRRQSNAGSFQSSLVILFEVLLTWSSVTHQPYNGCTVTSLAVDTALSSQGIINTIIVLVVLLYASLYSSQARLKQRIWPITEEKKAVQDDETYSHLFFHITMFLSCFHIMVSLSNWYHPDAKHFKPSWNAVWAKMAACSMCMWLYLWMLLSPLLRSEDISLKDNHDMPTIPSTTNNILNSSEKDPTCPGRKDPSRPPSIFPSEHCQSPLTRDDINNPVRVAHGSMSRKGSLHHATPDSHEEKEMLRLQGKIMRLQEKIAKLQTKVATLQGLQI